MVPRRTCYSASSVDVMVNGKKIRRIRPKVRMWELSGDIEKRTQKPKRHNNQRACEECKKRRIKCTRRIPCSSCTELGLECVISGVDRRTKEGRQLTRTDKKKDVHDDLSAMIEVIRGDDSLEGKELSNFINTGASVEAVQDYLQNQREARHVFDSPLNPPSDSLPKPPVQRLSPLAYPSKQVSTWTNVTDDEALVGLLLNVFFTWSHPHVWSCIEPELFLQAMEAGDLNSLFCSPFLVNAILSEACHYYIGPNKRDIQTQFTMEAERHWEDESGRTSLTNIQGLFSISIHYGMAGGDRKGWLYLTQALAMYNDLERQIRHTDRWDKHDEDFCRVVCKTGYKLFNTNAIAALALLKTTERKPPTLEGLDDSSTCCKADYEWNAYPLSMEAKAVHRACASFAENQFCIVVADLADIYYGTRDVSPADLPTELHRINTKLQTWYHNLPECFSLQGRPWPHTICMHSGYHWARIVLFGFLEKTRAKLQTNQQGAKASPTTTREEQMQLKDLYIPSAQAIAGLMQLYTNLYGYSYMQIFTTQPTTVALFVLLQDLDSAKSRAAFELLSACANANARIWPLGVGVMQLVQQSAKELGVDIPAKAKTYFEDFESNIASFPTTSSGKFTGDYPNFLIACGAMEESENLAAKIADLPGHTSKMSVSDRSEHSKASVDD